MKKILLLFMSVFAMNIVLTAQCVNSSQYPSTAVAITDSTLETINTCNYLEEYSIVTGVVAGETYEFTVTSSGYITVYQDGVSTTLLGNGTSPLSVISVTGGDMWVHWNVDATCTTATNCVITTVQWTSWTPPTCPVPTAQTVVDITATGATLDWTTGGASDWIIEWDTTGFTQGTGNLVTVSTFDSLILSGLIPETTYQWYVMDSCGAGDVSNWVGPNSFTTTATCPPPTVPTVTNLTTTTATLDWITGGSSDWIIEWDTAGFTQGTGTEVSVTSSDSLNITGLMANTDYEWYVRDYCGGTDSSVWLGPNAFYTGYCTPAPSSVDNDGITNVTMGTINNTTGAETGNYGDYSNLIADAMQTTTFNIDVTLGYNYGIWAWIDWNNDLDFDDAGEFIFLGESPSGNPSVLNSSIVIPATASLGNHRIRIGGSDFSHSASSSHNPCYTGTWGSFEDYTLNVLPPPPCIAPTIDSVSSITSTSADLHWTTGGSTNWDIEWGMAGFTQGSGTMISNTTTNPYSLSGLNSATAYEFYVRDLCGADTSTWAGPFAFSTLCPTNYTAPFCETFDGGTVGCWGNETVTDQFNWFLRTGTTPSSNTGPDAAHGGAQYIYTETSGTSNGDTAILYSPAIDLTALTTPAIDFYYHMYGTGMDADGTFAIDVSNDGGTTWTNVFSEMGNHGNQWNNGYVEMAAFAGDTVIFRFLGIVSTTGTDYENDFALDDFCVIEALPCPGAPSELNAQNITGSTALISWMSNFSATNWVIEYDTAGFTQGTGNIVSVATDTFTTLTGLMPDTEYDFYVRDYCGGTDSSNWSGSFTFTTDYCLAPVSVFPYVEDFESGANGWNTKGVNGTWELGTPAATIINSAASGTNAWVTNLTGLYNANDNSYIQNCFDFTTIANPELHFNGWIESENSYDGANIYTSIDAGATWQILGSMADVNWFNDGTISGLNYTGSQEGFTGSLGTGGWIPLSHDLTGLGGQPDVRIRFNFGSDGSVQREGAGIDDIVICQTVVNATAIPMNLCDGDTFTLNSGGIVTMAGMYNDTLTASTGCDSVITLDFSILMPTFDTTDITICQGTPYTLPGGTVITNAGTYDEMFTNAVGCDSTATYNVVVNVATSSMQTVHLCDGATFTLPLSGLVVSMANDYVETTTNAVGCDSTITYNVTTGMSSVDTNDIDLCMGSMYITPNGDTITTAGMHTFTFVNNTGCNHMATYNVTMISPSASSMTASACASYTWAVDGNSYTSSGMYDYTTTNANGCDSVITLNLTINMPTGSNMSETICSGDSYTFGTLTLTTAGIYNETFTNAVGCDSIVTLVLMVDNASDNNESATICSGDTYQFGTQSLTSAGTYTESFTNNNGCSYTTTLTLTVNNTTSSSQKVVLCEQDNNQFTLANGTVVTEAGTYTATVTGSNGCDETITYVISDCVGIFDIDNNVGITLFPNPAKNVLNVVFSEKLSNTNNITVVDLLGKAIYTLDNVEGVNLTINTSKIANGLYYLNVTSDNKTSVKSFTISK